MFDFGSQVEILTSRERPKSALYLRLKIVKKGDPLGFVKLQLVAKYEKKLQGGPLGILKKFPEKTFPEKINEIFELCQSAEKCKRGAFGIF